MSQDPQSSSRIRTEPQASGADRLSAGELIDDAFEIIGLLGEGGMSVVYRAKDRQLDREVALKFLRFGSSAAGTEAARFHREAQAICNLQHPNIVRLYRFGTWQGQPYMAMELLLGKSLHQRLVAEGKLAPEEARHIFDEICQAMQFAHERGIIHRDLKPSNIMIADSDGSVKLVDFGLAKLNRESAAELQKLTQTHQLIGTLLYLSPEQCLGKTVDARADIYSMGCLMHECLTGQLPFNGETAFAVVYQHLNDVPISSDEIAEPFRSLISRCLEKDPANRPQSFSELSDGLNGGVVRSKGSHPTLEVKPQRWSNSSRSSKLVLTICAAVILAGGACAWFFQRGMQDSAPKARSGELYRRAVQLHEQATYYQTWKNTVQQAQADAALRRCVDETLKAQEVDHLLEPGHLASLYHYGMQAYEGPDPEKSLYFRTKQIEMFLSLTNKEHDIATEVVGVGTTLHAHKELCDRIIAWLHDIEKTCRPHTPFLRNSFQFAYASTYANSGRYAEARTCWNKIPPGGPFCAKVKSREQLQALIDAHTK